jgi:hypothetical protein
MKLGLALAAIAVAFPLSASAANIYLFDSAPTASSYEFTTYLPAGESFTTSNYAAQGQYGYFDKALGFYYRKDGQATLVPRYQAMNTSFVYDPSVEGAILSIDAALTQKHYLYLDGQSVTPSTPIAFTLRVLAEQDGKLYEASAFGGAAPGLMGWNYSSLTGLVASDFLLFDRDNPYAPRTETGLDFTGGSIRFGFEVVPQRVIYTNGNPIPQTSYSTAFYEVDDFGITLRTGDIVAGGGVGVGGVPEPATWALMITGFGLTGVGLRRRRLAVA